MLDLRMEGKKLNAGDKIAGYCADRSLLNLKRIREIFWSGRPDLNRRPPAPKAGALPGCATPRHEMLPHYRALRSFPSAESSVRGCGPYAQFRSSQWRVKPNRPGWRYNNGYAGYLPARHKFCTQQVHTKEVLCKPHSSIAAVFSAYPLSPEEEFSSLSISILSEKCLDKRRKLRPPLSNPRHFCASLPMAS